MIRALVDTNIVLDVFLERQPFVTPAKELFDRADAGTVELYLAATTLTNIFYIVRKHKGLSEARKAVETLVQNFAVAPIDHSVLQKALAKTMPDFEDAVQDAAAEALEIGTLVSRDAKGYAGAFCKVLDAAGLVQAIDAQAPK